MSQLARLQEEIDKLRQQYDDEALAKMGEVCQLTFAEHEVYQRWKAVAQMHGLISLELSCWLYDRLGAMHSVDGNGGWPVAVGNTEKVLVTALFGRLQQELERRRLL